MAVRGARPAAAAGRSNDARRRAARRLRRRMEVAQPAAAGYAVHGVYCAGAGRGQVKQGQGAASRAQGRSAAAGGGGGAPLRLDMQIRDFGPIKKGSISLRPLTILIGPSNTGKSYAAMLAHSIITASRGAAGRPLSPASIPAHGALGRLSRDVRGMLLALAPGEARRCPPATASGIAGLCRRALSARLRGEIEFNFASPARDMARHGAGRFSVALAGGGRRVMSYGGGRLSLGPAQRIDVVFRATRAGSGGGAGRLEVAGRGDGTLHCTADRGLIASEAGQAASERLCRMIAEKALPLMVPGLPASSAYIPAARAGILQAHAAISSYMARGAPCSGAEDAQSPRLPGVVSDFVSDMIDMYPVRGPYFDMGSRMESDMLGGHIVPWHSGRGAFPEMVYRSRGGGGRGVPVRRASSTVSELAPLALFLKHRIARGGMLVVEEPEAHLHPDDQLRLAGHVVGMVRGGVNAVITTHGDTLFEAIGQYLEASAMPPKSRRRALGAGGLYLCEDEVAAHLFAPGRGGSTAERIDSSARDGIKQDEFIRVAETLCENNARIEEYLG